MKTVGVRELKQSASQVLAQVEQGESFVVTVQGRPVASLTPAQVSTWISAERLMAVYDVPTVPTFWKTSTVPATKASSMTPGNGTMTSEGHPGHLGPDRL